MHTYTHTHTHTYIHTHTGLKPIHIKIKETAELYKIVKGNNYMNLQIDHYKLPKQWLHPADRAITIDEDNTQEDPTHINIYTDGGKSEQDVGEGIAIKRSATTTVELMYTMDTRCTNNLAEAFAILKVLEYVQTTLENDVDKVTAMYTDSRTTLESLHNMNKHTFLTEEIRRKVKEMGSRGWSTRSRWTKAH